MELIPGYHLMSSSEDELIAGISFEHFHKESAESVEYEGKTYKRGMIVMIPKGYSGTFCSARAYNLIA